MSFTWIRGLGSQTGWTNTECKHHIRPSVHITPDGKQNPRLYLDFILPVDDTLKLLSYYIPPVLTSYVLLRVTRWWWWVQFRTWELSVWRLNGPRGFSLGSGPSFLPQSQKGGSGHRKWMDRHQYDSLGSQKLPQITIRQHIYPVTAAIDATREQPAVISAGL